MIQNQPNSQQDPLQAASVPPSDRLTDTKTIYQAGGWEIFWRNFLAGFSRALGALVLYFTIFFILAGLLNYYLMPYLRPLLGTLTQTFETLNQLTPQSGKNTVNPIFSDPNLQQLLQQAQ